MIHQNPYSLSIIAAGRATASHIRRKISVTFAAQLASTSRTVGEVLSLLGNWGVHPLHANQQTGLGKPGKGAPHGNEITCFAADAIDNRDRYARAREEQADKLFREIIEIADDASGDYVTTSDGKRIVDHENIQRSRLRVDARSGRKPDSRRRSTATT